MSRLPGSPPAPSRWAASVRAAGLLAFGAATAWVLVGAARDALPGRGPATAEDVLSALVAGAGAAVGAWLATSAALSLAALLPGAVGSAAAHLAERLTPTMVRRVLALTMTTTVGTVALPSGTATADVAHAVGLGDTPAPSAFGVTDTSGRATDQTDASRSASEPAALGSVASAPSPGFVVSTATSTTAVNAPSPGFAPSHDPAGTHAAMGSPAQAPSPATSPATSPALAPSPGWRPDRPVPSTDPARTDLLSPTPRTGSMPAVAVVVHRGDTLWSIAARALGPGATDVEIAHEWPRWYAANRDVIGADPDLIRPGQQLVPPTTETTR